MVQESFQRPPTASELDIDDLVQTYHLRGILETEAVKQAIPNLGDDEIKAMRASMSSMEHVKGDGVNDLLEENRNFHFILFSASRNNRLDALLRQLWDSCDRYRALYYAKPTDLARVIDEHREIFDACEARSVKRVVGLLKVHRDGGLEAMKRIFGAGGADGQPAEPARARKVAATA